MQLMDKSNNPFGLSTIRIQDFTDDNWNNMIELDQLIFQEAYPKGDPLTLPKKINEERVNPLDVTDIYYYFLYREEQFWDTESCCNTTRNPQIMNKRNILHK